MNIVIDSNILFSALIKKSITRKLILEYDGHFLFPSYIFVEMEKHKRGLLKKSQLREDEFNTLLSLILEKVVIVNDKEILKHRAEAMHIVKDIDMHDAVFIACALALKGVIWTDDKRLKKQSEIRIMNTREMMQFLK